MIRPLDLKHKGEPLVESDSIPQLYKDACFYLGKKFEYATDEEYKNWLIERRDNGYMEKDILKLEDDVYRGEFRYLIKVFDRLPPYISSIISDLLAINGLIEIKKFRGDG